MNRYFKYSRFFFVSLPRRISNVGFFFCECVNWEKLAHKTEEKKRKETTREIRIFVQIKCKGREEKKKQIEKENRDDKKEPSTPIYLPIRFDVIANIFSCMNEVSVFCLCYVITTSKYKIQCSVPANNKQVDNIWLVVSNGLCFFSITTDFIRTGFFFFVADYSQHIKRKWISKTKL